MGTFRRLALSPMSYFHTTLPPEWGNMTRLATLHFNVLSLSGSIPDSWGGMTAMESFSLVNGKGLSGTLPESLSQWSLVSTIDLLNNNLTGSIPTSWKNLSRLKSLELSVNALSGSLSCEWFGGTEPLQSFGVSHNMFSGTIPECWSSIVSEYAYFNIDHNALSGPLPSALPSKHFVGNHNRFSGTVPESYGACMYLYLHNNLLSGPLPSWRDGITGLEVRLDNNDFEGTIPSSWVIAGSRDSQFSRVNLANNSRLTGILPSSWSQRMFVPQWVFVCEGNPGLCPSNKTPFSYDPLCLPSARKIIPWYCRSESLSATVTISETAEAQSHSQSMTRTRVVIRRFTTGLAQPLATGALVLVSLLSTPTAIGSFPSLQRSTTTRLRLLDCASTIDDPPNVYECPLAFAVGSGPGSVLRGSIAGSIVLLCLCAVPTVLAAVLPERLRVVRLGVRWLNLPSLFVVPLMSRLTMLARAHIRSKAADYVMYLVGYGLCLATVGWIVWVVCRRAERFDAVATEAKRHPLRTRRFQWQQAIDGFVSDSCEWRMRTPTNQKATTAAKKKKRSNSTSLFVEKHACLFEDFRAGRHWCLTVELCGLLLGSIIDSLQPILTPFDDPAAMPIQDVVLTCRGALIATAALECAMLAALAVLRPERRLVDVAATLLFHTLASVTAVLAVVMDADTSAEVSGIVAWLSFGQSLLVMAVVGIFVGAPKLMKLFVAVMRDGSGFDVTDDEEEEELLRICDEQILQRLQSLIGMACADRSKKKVAAESAFGNDARRAA